MLAEPAIAQTLQKREPGGRRVRRPRRHARPSQPRRRGVHDRGRMGRARRGRSRRRHRRALLRRRRRPVEHPVNDRVIGLTLDELRQVPLRVIAAGGPDKDLAIQAALAAGIISVLVTDAGTAERALAAQRGNAPPRAPEPRRMTVVPSVPPCGFDRARAARAMREGGIGAMLLTSPENVFYTTGYTSLPSAGNPILYTLRSRLPYFAYVDGDGRGRRCCAGASRPRASTSAPTRSSASTSYAERARRRCERAARPRCRRRDARRRGRPARATCSSVDRGGGIAPRSSPRPTRRSPRCGSSSPPRRSRCSRRSTEIIERRPPSSSRCCAPGMSRREIMLEARTRLLRNGANGISHLTFSFGDSNPEVEADEPLAAGRLVTLDLGGDRRRATAPTTAATRYLGDDPAVAAGALRHDGRDRRRRRRGARARARRTRRSTSSRSASSPSTASS